MDQRQSRAQGAGRTPDPAGAGTDRSNDIAGGPEGLGSLISGVVKDLQDLLRSEVQLAKTELKEDAAALGKGAALLAAGALVGLVGFIFLMLAVTYLLSRYLRDWIAAGIVALVLLAVAAILAQAGRGKLQAGNLKPEQTIETLKEDKEWASQQISSAKR